MYFTNLYVSILNIFTNGVEAMLDVPCLLVKPGLLGKCNCTSIVTVGGNDTYGITGIPSMVGGRGVVQRAGPEASTRIVYPGSGHEDA